MVEPGGFWFGIFWGILLEFYRHSLGIFWGIQSEFIGILWDFFKDVWLGALTWKLFGNSFWFLREFFMNSLGNLYEFLGILSELYWNYLSIFWGSMVGGSDLGNILSNISLLFLINNSSSWRKKYSPIIQGCLNYVLLLLWYVMFLPNLPESASRKRRLCAKFAGKKSYGYTVN